MQWDSVYVTSVHVCSYNLYFAVIFRIIQLICSKTNKIGMGKLLYEFKKIFRRVRASISKLAQPVMKFPKCIFTFHSALVAIILCCCAFIVGWNIIVDGNSTWNGWVQEVVTKRLVGSTRNRFRNENNNYYVYTRLAFHGFLVGNFWRRKNARTATSFPNLYHFFIIQVVRLYFCGVALWDSQLNTSFWAIKWSKNESKNVEFLLLQTSPQCSQE